MSIWGNVGIGGPDILAAHDGLEDDLPTVRLGIATSGMDEHIRLAVDDDSIVNVRLLLSHEAAALLRDRLTEALAGELKRERTTP
uniref:hypothetical protein n=1 Tax=Herbidospora sakaeratensis TaxID=564415 RepID=UPI00078045B9|nr:hypothetical protein [Herbidospora sakaeratensis]